MNSILMLPKQSISTFLLRSFETSKPGIKPHPCRFGNLKLIHCRKRTEVPIYSFAKHAREKETSVIYSPHVLILEGIFALHDPRILELLDLKVFAEADADLCLSRRRKYSIHLNPRPKFLHPNTLSKFPHDKSFMRIALSRWID
jgi:pantothenate kinase